MKKRKITYIISGTLLYGVLVPSLGLLITLIISKYRICPVPPNSGWEGLNCIGHWLETVVIGMIIVYILGIITSYYLMRTFRLDRKLLRLSIINIVIISGIISGYVLDTRFHWAVGALPIIAFYLLLICAHWLGTVPKSEDNTTFVAGTHQ